MLCRGRSKCSATPLATSPLPGCFNTHSKTTKIIKNKAAGVANRKTKANRDNPGVVAVALTMAAMETDSTEATVAVADTIKAAV